jgi:DNA invertase Pin-like site-specific DNA recombinase
MRDLLRIVDLIQGKKAALRILGTDIDTGTPTGKLMLNLLGSFAEFERQIMLERQRAGIARAKAEGKFKGRKPTARAVGRDYAITWPGRRRGRDRAPLGDQPGVRVPSSRGRITAPHTESGKLR